MNGMLKEGCIRGNAERRVEKGVRETVRLRGCQMSYITIFMISSIL